MKKRLLICVAILLFLTSCGSTIHSLDGIAFETEETIPAEQQTEFWKSLEAFSYLKAEEEGRVEEVISVEETPTVMRSGNPGFLDLNLNGLPYEYCEETGSLICLHTDPLCHHGGGECPFAYSTEGFREYEGNVYFSVLEINLSEGDKKADRVLNTKAMTVKTLRTRDLGVMCSTAVYDGNVRYVYDISCTDDGQEIWQLIRQNLKSGKLDILEETEEMPPLLLYIRDDIFLWYHSGYAALSVSRRDSLLERKEVVTGMRDGIVFAEEDRIWFPMQSGGVNGIGYYGFEDGETGFLSLPGQTDSAWFSQFLDMTERYIYYLSGEERKASIRQKEGRNTDRMMSPAEIVRLDRVSGEVEHVLTLDGILSEISVQWFTVSGNYLYAPLEFVENETDYSLIGGCVLRVGLTDGSLYVISAPDQFDA